MIRRLPILPTIIVLAAAATMVALGFWQLQRLDEKEALIARYQRVLGDETAVPYPRSDAAAELALYRRSTVYCDQVIERRGGAGRSAAGESGIAQIATCRLDGGGTTDIALGFSRNPDPVAWAGGEIGGIVAPGPRLVADPPIAGLEPLAKPDPTDLPNNHLAYAGQWFFFALTALVIYGLAIRKRLREQA